MVLEAKFMYWEEGYYALSYRMSKKSLKKRLSSKVLDTLYEKSKHFFVALNNEMVESEYYYIYKKAFLFQQKLQTHKFFLDGGKKVFT